jgi:hypothetical protein
MFRAVTMRQSQAHIEDLRLDTERRRICKGSARVKFEDLKWDEYIKRNPTKRKPDSKHVEHIKGYFKKWGCLQLQVGNHIPAKIGQHRLDVALQEARRKKRWTADPLPSNDAIINTRDGYPKLDFTGGIECLHGLHRIEAGKEWLLPTDKWWIVDLYLSDISYDLETLLMDEYANEKKPCDGEIYRKIREYESVPSDVDYVVRPVSRVSFAMRWWSRFPDSRARKLRSLFKNESLATRFNILATIPGLFDAGMMVTTLHEVLAMKCYEVSMALGVATRLTYIPVHSQWSTTLTICGATGMGS